MISVAIVVCWLYEIGWDLYATDLGPLKEESVMIIIVGLNHFMVDFNTHHLKQTIR